MDSLRIILGARWEHYSEAERVDLAEEKNRIYQKHLTSLSPDDLSEDVRFTLNSLRQRGYLLAIGSSSKNAKLILDRLGLADFFDAVADGTQITHSKPNPEVFLLAAEKLGITPEKAIVVEDSASGIQAAAAGCFHAIGLRSDFNDPNSEISIKRFCNLLEIL